MNAPEAPYAAQWSLPTFDAAWRWIERHYGPFGHLKPDRAVLQLVVDQAERLEALEARVAELEARRGRAVVKGRRP